MTEYSLLLVLNEEQFLDSYATWFSRRRFHVTTAPHPRLAMAAAAYNDFDAAVIDVKLPELNGLDLIDKLKGISNFPIVLLSDDDDPRLMDAAIERGVYRFLLKPVSMRAIEEVVREAVDQAHSTPRTTNPLELLP